MALAQGPTPQDFMKAYQASLNITPRPKPQSGMDLSPGSSISANMGLGVAGINLPKNTLGTTVASPRVAPPSPQITGGSQGGPGGVSPTGVNQPPNNPKAGAGTGSNGVWVNDANGKPVHYASWADYHAKNQVQGGSPTGTGTGTDTGFGSNGSNLDQLLMQALMQQLNGGGQNNSHANINDFMSAFGLNDPNYISGLVKSQQAPYQQQIQADQQAQKSEDQLLNQQLTDAVNSQNNASFQNWLKAREGMAQRGLANSGFMNQAMISNQLNNEDRMTGIYNTAMDNQQKSDSQYAGDIAKQQAAMEGITPQSVTSGLMKDYSPFLPYYAETMAQQQTGNNNAIGDLLKMLPYTQLTADQQATLSGQLPNGQPTVAAQSAQANMIKDLYTEAASQGQQTGVYTDPITGQKYPTLTALNDAENFTLKQAGVTGTYNGAPTLQAVKDAYSEAAQQAQQTGIYKDPFTGKTYTTEKAFTDAENITLKQTQQEAQYGGMYNGQPTLQAQNDAASQAATQQKINNAYSQNVFNDNLNVEKFVADVNKTVFGENLASAKLGEQKAKDAFTQALKASAEKRTMWYQEQTILDNQAKTAVAEGKLQLAAQADQAKWQQAQTTINDKQVTGVLKGYYDQMTKATSAMNTLMVNGGQTMQSPQVQKLYKQYLKAQSSYDNTLQGWLGQLGTSGGSQSGNK